MATNAVDRKTIDAMNEQVRQQMALEEEQRRLMKEARKAAKQLKRSQRKTDKAKALNAARQTGYSGTIIMLNGKPYQVAYQSRPAQIVQSGNMAPPSLNTAPQYTRQTVNGIPIVKIFRGFQGELYAVGRMDGGALIWGRGYDPRTGFWKGGDYNLTAKQIGELSYGMECVVDNGALGTTVKKSTSGQPNRKAKKRTAPPKNPSKNTKGSPNKSGSSRNSKAGGSKNTKTASGNSRASKNTKGSPNKSPNTKNSTANRAPRGSSNKGSGARAGKC